MLIGISGKKNVGKDTVAGMFEKLVRPGLVEKMAFADPLKEVLSGASGIPLSHFYDQSLKELQDPLTGLVPRGMMERANEPFKKWWGNNVFVTPMHMRYQESKAVLFIATDVRFEVEAAWVRASGGHVVHVLRDTGHQSDAASEQGVTLQTRDYVIHNDSSLADLFGRVTATYQDFFTNI